jgi:hypothetical protein
LVGPILLLLLQVFTSPPAIVLHKKFVEGRYGRTSWFGCTTRNFPTTVELLTRPLPSKEFVLSLSLSLFKIERKIETKGKKKVTP